MFENTIVFFPSKYLKSVSLEIIGIVRIYQNFENQISSQIRTLHKHNFTQVLCSQVFITFIYLTGNRYYALDLKLVPAKA